MAAQTRRSAVPGFETKWVVAVLTSVALVACGPTKSTPDGGLPGVEQPDAGQLDAGLAEARPWQEPGLTDGGAHLRLQARTIATGVPMPGVLFTVDHGGRRVELWTNADGDALLNAPDWDAGAVDVTVLRQPSITVPGPWFDSYLGIPRGEAFTAFVNPALPARTVVTGTFSTRMVPGSTVYLGGVPGVDYFQDSTDKFTINTWGRRSLDLLGLEFTLGSGIEIQHFEKWFKVAVPDVAASVTVDIAAAPALPVTTRTLGFQYPGGAVGPFRNASAYVIVYAPEDDYELLDGPLVGVPTTSQKSADGSQFDFSVEQLVDPSPFMRAPSTPVTYVSLSSQGNTPAFEMHVRRPVADGEVLQSNLVPPVVNPAAHPVRLPSPFAIAPRVGAMRTLQLYGRTDAASSLYRSWSVRVLDERAEIRVPERPAHAPEVPPSSWASASFCTGWQGFDCESVARSALYTLVP